MECFFQIILIDSNLNSFNYLIAASCNEFGNYVGNEIDSEENVNYAGKCQKLCLEHSQCKFWTYDYSNKKCYRQTEKAATALGTCKTCIRGPRSCSGKIIKIEFFF